MTGGSITEDNRPGPMTWVFTQKDLGYLLAAIATSSEVVIDLETTGLDEHAWLGGRTNGGVAARTSLASLTLPQRENVSEPDSQWDGVDPTTWIVPLSHPDSPWLGEWVDIFRQILSQIRQFSRPVENQNMKFDARWGFAMTGVDLADLIVWDTQVSSQMLDENSSTKLKDRAPKTFGITRWDDHDLSTPGASERVPLFELGEYAARDTYWTWKLVMQHRRQMFLPVGGPDAGAHLEQPESPEDIENARLGKLMTWVGTPTVQSLTRIEQRGWRLDVPWVEEHLEADSRTAREGLDWMAEHYGQNRADASMHATSTWFKEFTALAVEKGELVIAATTGSGAPQWNKSVLLRQVKNNQSEVAAKILEARAADKRAQFLRSWLHHVTRDGFIHTTYKAGSVVTGRLSSVDPNMQQVTKELKPAFIPRDDFYQVDFDYSQLELRVAAFIARAFSMIEAFRRGDDLHRLFAARIAGVAPEDVTPLMRTKAKAGNFGLLYLMGAYGFKYYAEDNYDVVLTEAEAVQIHRLFFEMWPELKVWHQKTIAKLHQTGQVVSPLGRVRRLPGVFDGNPSMVGYSERAGVNSPVQGFGSDLMQMAAASIQGLLPGSTAIPLPLVGTVHDSIVGEVPIDRWQELVGDAQERMENLDRVLARMGVEFDVPLVADATVGTRWGWDDISNPKEKAA